MRRKSEWAGIRAVGVAVVLMTFLSGCTHIGIRPGEPGPPKTAIGGCEEFKEYVKYAQGLQESYLSRAIQNRAWIYVAGITGLGVVAATGGLAAAAAAGVGTLALLSISGGFSAGVFATLDNSTLASIYTIAANEIDSGITEALGTLPTTGTSRWSSDVACLQALAQLRSAVTEARTTLEEARTSSAKAALVRAKAEQKALSEFIATQEEGDPTRELTRARIVAVLPARIQPGPPNVALEVEVTVESLRLDRVADRDVRFRVGSREVGLSGAAPKTLVAPNTYKLKFMVPVAPPDPGVDTYVPKLLIGPSRRHVGAADGVTLEYK